MLTACVDDSGSRAGPIYLLSAVVATVESWIALTTDWDRELHERPAAAYFKIQEAVRCVGQFTGASSRPELIAFKLDKFGSIMRRHIRFAVHVAMHVNSFDHLVRPGFEELERSNPDLGRISSPYFLLALSLIRMLDFLDFEDDEMNIVFDEQGAEGMLVREWWPGLAETFNRKGPTHRIRTMPDFRSDQTFIPLQAANAIAWTLHREYAREYAPTSLADAIAPPPRINEWLHGVRFKSHWLGSKDLTVMARNLFRQLGE